MVLFRSPIRKHRLLLSFFRRALRALALVDRFCYVARDFGRPLKFVSDGSKSLRKHRFWSNKSFTSFYQ